MSCLMKTGFNMTIKNHSQSNLALGSSISHRCAFDEHGFTFIEQLLCTIVVGNDSHAIHVRENRGHVGSAVRKPAHACKV